MIGERRFVDSNVLIYAYDQDAGSKRARAGELLASLWESATGVVSVQVLQEFFTNATRKLKQPLDSAKAREVVRIYGEWVAAPTDPSHVLRAVDIMKTYQLSFWDSMIVAVAEATQCGILFSEDMQHGQIIAGVRIENPFLTTSPQNSHRQMP